MRWRKRLLSSRKLNGPFEALSVSLQAYSGGWNLRTFHHEPVYHGNGSADGRDLGIATDDGDQVSLGLPGRIRQHLADETVQVKSDAGGGFLRALHIREPSEAEMGILHLCFPRVFR
jgi:hypothetical protein